MMMKDIEISQTAYEALSELASKNETFDDVVMFLISYYKSNEYFSDEEAEFYNKEIEKFENGGHENFSKLTLEDLERDKT